MQLSYIKYLEVELPNGLKLFLVKFALVALLSGALFAECQQEGVDAPAWVCNSKDYTGTGIDEIREVAFEKSCLNLNEKIKIKIRKTLNSEDLVDKLSQIKLTEFKSIDFWVAPSGMIYSAVTVSENFINKQIQKNVINAGLSLENFNSEFKVLKDGYPNPRLYVEEEENGGD